MEFATAASLLGMIYQAQGRYTEAEPLHRRALAIYETTLGREHSVVTTPLNALASLYGDQGRYADAEPIFKRSLAIRESALRHDRPSAGTGKNFDDLAVISRDIDRDAVPRALHNLAELYEAQGRYADAEPLLKRSLAMDEAALGRDHPSVATGLNNLAGLYVALGRHTDAEPLYKSSFAIREKALGPDHPKVAVSLNNLAFVALAQRDWGQAADYWRRAIGVIERRAVRGLAGAAEGSSKGEAQRSSWYFVGVVQTTHHLATERRASGVPAAEMFETAQWALASEAAASLAQMAARSAAGSPELAGLVRERQDLVGEWQAKDKLLIAAKGQEPGKGSATAEKALADRLDAIDARLAEIGRKLGKDFPDYAALASPASVSDRGRDAHC